MGLSVRIYCDWKIGRYFNETSFREREKKRTKTKKKIATKKEFAKKSSKSSNLPNAPTEDKRCNTYWTCYTASRTPCASIGMS